MKRVALHAAAALATLAAVLVLWRLREGVLLLALSLATAATVRPAVDRMVAHRVPRGAALGIVYGAALALCATVIFVIGGSLLGDAQRSVDDLSRTYERIQSASPPVGGLRGILINYFPPAAEFYRSMVGGAWGATISVVDLVGRSIIVLALAIYWTASQDAFEYLALSLVPIASRDRARKIWQSIESAVGARLRSELGQSLLGLFLLAACFHALGLRYATLPAAAGAIARFVPIVGAPLAILAAFAAGAATGPWHAVGAAACATGTMLLLKLALAPRFSSTQRRNAILEVVTMIVLLNAYGVAGLIAAAPLAVALNVLGGELLRTPEAIGPRFGDLDVRLRRLRARLATAGEAVPQELESIVDRLGRLLVAAEKPGKKK